MLKNEQDFYIGNAYIHNDDDGRVLVVIRHVNGLGEETGDIIPVCDFDYYKYKVDEERNRR